MNEANPAALLAKADELRGKSLELTTLRKLADVLRPQIETGRPVKGSPEWDLWVAAIDVAMNAPLRQGTYVTSAKVYWPLIKRLRDTLEAVGIDWRPRRQGAGRD